MSTQTLSSRNQRTAPDARFQVAPCPAALGTEIHGIDLRTMDDNAFKAIHDVWLDHVLLVFRGQSLDANDLVRLVHRFSTPVSSSNLHQRNLQERTANQLFNPPPEVTVVTELTGDRQA